MAVARSTCKKCQKPLVTCICVHIVSVLPSLPVVILQHPSEVHKSKSTTFILGCCLNDVKVVVGESFSESLLVELGFSGFSPLLLFPGDNSSDFSTIKGSGLSKPPVLIVLDGTWRKAKKILFSNPWLHSIPKVCFSHSYSSCYPLRRSEKLEEGMLSTTEAVMHALAEWSGCLLLPHGSYQLLKPLLAIIENEKKHMGVEKFNRYYDIDL